MQFPNIDPVAFQLGPLKVHWYGLMYLFGFVGAYLLAQHRARKPDSGWTADQVADLIFYAAVGVIVGGRLGYKLFYDFSSLIHNPLSVFAVWQGGMSFHGGLLGVLVAMLLISKKCSKSYFSVGDFVVPLLPLGLGLGRLGNFIGGELFGRITTVPWAMVFPGVGALPRHPSQLYQFLLEGVVLFVLLWWYSSKKRHPGTVAALFLIGYAVVRFAVEFARQPDAHIGFIAFDWLTMGQLLTIPMMLWGLGIMIWAYRQQRIKH